jgi:hypothetical protein
MNIFVYNLAKSERHPLVIEDNVGEAIHIHYKTVRIDFTIKEFIEFSKKMEEVKWE